MAVGAGRRHGRGGEGNRHFLNPAVQLTTNRDGRRRSGCAFAVLGWFSAASTWASRVKRARRPGSAANESGRTLIATSRFSLVPVAR